MVNKESMIIKKDIIKRGERKYEEDNIKMWEKTTTDWLSGNQKRNVNLKKF